MTDRAPALLPAPGRRQRHEASSTRPPANDLLLADLRSDRGMEWVPDQRRG